MGIQTATTGNLENAQAIIIAQMRYTQEHNMPTAALVEHLNLTKGNKQMTVPKGGQVTADNLVDGQDLINSEDIALSTVDLTTGEVGLKFVLTDKLLYQFNEDVFKIIGRMTGDAMARKMERDLQALFSGLNGGTSLGADNTDLNMRAAGGLAAFARANKFPSPVSVVHHPNALASLAMNAQAVGATYYAGILGSLSEDLLRDYWKIKIAGVNFFESGEIDKIASVDSGYGAIFSKSAMCILTSKTPNTERERDASLRGWEVVTVADYGVFELDDTYGAPARYEIGQLVTT